MLQSIRSRAFLRQASWRRPSFFHVRWLRLGVGFFRRHLPATLWVVVVFPLVIFNLPMMQTHAGFTLTQVFHNPNTRATLQAMASTKTPLVQGVVSFLLNVARSRSDAGDALIQWDATGRTDYNDGTQMHLNGAAFDANDPYALASYAGQITHEAVELYFRQADGIPGDTLPMDYLAEYEGGLVMQAVGAALSTPLPEPGTGTGQISTVGRSYDDWLASGNGAAYDEPSESGTSWHFLWWSGPLQDQALFGNPIGLSLAMLRWETSCGGETLPDWQTRGCAEAAA
jgi:hypothetical protein